MAQTMTYHAARIVNRTGLAAAAILISILMLGIANASAATGKRVALVIGNSAYEHAPALVNPANDAADMAQSLREIGFTVVEGLDQGNRGMREKMREFANELRGAEVGMIYYAGHGLQVNGQNYLAPIDAKLDFENDLDFETIPMEFIQRQMEREVKTMLIFLDACRDNPLSRSFKTASRSTGASRGLAAEETSAVSGTLIAFSTNPGNVALDGKGRNSPFTAALVKNIKRPGVEISTLMTDVRKDVVEATNGQQTPWINSSLLGRFYFVEGNAGEGDNSQKVAALDTSSENKTSDANTSSNSNSGALSQAQIEKLAWDTVQDSERVEDLEAFIQTFGGGFYGKLAKIRLDSIKARQAEKAGTAAAEKAEETKVASLDTKESPKEETRTADTGKEKEPLDPREVALGIQNELDRLGCDVGQPDGLWGNRSQRGLDSFARVAKIELASSSPTEDLLNQLRDYNGKGCPVVKQAAPVKQQPARNLTKSCPEGQKLSSKGNCFTPKQQASVQPVQKQRRQQVIVENQGEEIIVEQQPVRRQQRVIVQQQQPVIVEQHQQRDNSVGRAIIGGIVGGVTTCILTGC